MPELGPIEALAALRRGDRNAAEAALGELRARPNVTTWSRLGLATAVALADRSAEALAALVALGPEIDGRLERPGNEVVLELAFAAPEVWLEALAEMSRRSAAAERLELILAVLLESRGDLEAALAIVRPLSDSLHSPFRDFARARARRIETKVTQRSRI